MTTSMNRSQATWFLNDLTQGCKYRRENEGIEYGKIPEELNWIHTRLYLREKRENESA